MVLLDGELEAVLGDESDLSRRVKPSSPPAGVKHGFVNRSGKQATLMAIFPRRRWRSPSWSSWGGAAVGRGAGAAPQGVDTAVSQVRRCAFKDGPGGRPGSLWRRNREAGEYPMKRENTDPTLWPEPNMMAGIDRGREPSGLSGRLRRAAGSAGKRVVGSAQAFAGADIRQFQDFADAATTVVVGVHRAQAEMNDRLASVEQSCGHA